MKKNKSYQAPHKAAKAMFTYKTKKENIYGGKWREYREIFLKHNPECYVCGDLATVVDHIEPHKDDIRVFWKVDNYLPECKRCHDIITNMFDRRHVVGTRPLKKLEFIANQREMRDLVKRVKVVPFSKELEEWIAGERARLLKEGEK